MANLLCANPANGTHIVVHGNLREDTRKQVLQRVLAWAENDRDLIEYHSGGDVPYVRIPPEVIAGDHGELTLRKGGEPVELAIDRAVWLQPTIFDVDGINPNTLIDYDQVVEDLGPKGEVTHDRILMKWTYSGNSQEKTEPHAWIMRYRQVAAKNECPHKWMMVDLPGWARVVPFHGLTPETEYEFTLQGIAKPESTDVYTPSTEPVKVKTAKPPKPGTDPDNELPPSVPGPQNPGDAPSTDPKGGDGSKGNAPGSDSPGDSKPAPKDEGEKKPAPEPKAPSK